MGIDGVGLDRRGVTSVMLRPARREGSRKYLIRTLTPPALPTPAPPSRGRGRRQLARAGVGVGENTRQGLNRVVITPLRHIVQSDMYHLRYYTYEDRQCIRDYLEALPFVISCFSSECLFFYLTVYRVHK